MVNGIQYILTASQRCVLSETLRAQLLGHGSVPHPMMASILCTFGRSTSRSTKDSTPMEIKPVITQSVQATERLKDVRCLATVKQTNDTLRIIKCQAPIAQRPIYAHIEERITADNIRFSVCPLRQPETDGLLQGVKCDKSTATSKHAFAPPPLRQVIHTLY